MLSNEELVKLIKEGQDPDGKYMMDLWKQNKGLIWRTVKPYANYESEEDLMQEAFIGLSKAVGLFDPNMGASFITYALFWVKQFVVRFLDLSFCLSFNWLPFNKSLPLANSIKYFWHICFVIRCDYVDVN